MRLSIVTTLYRGAPYLREFHERCCAAAEKITDEFEILLVNDSSPDESLAVALELHEKDRRVRVIDLARNFGQHKAILTGLAHARGELVFSLDSDLEEDPDWLGLFYERMKETGADVVYGVQRKRKGRFFERISGAVYYAIFSLLSSHTVPANQVAARLMTRRYVESLIEHRDHEVFLAGLWAITGYEQVPVPVEKADKGSSSYSLRKKLSIMLNSVTSFSNVPLVLIFYLGMFVTFVSLSAVLFTFVAKVFFIDFELGWPSLIISIWLLSGLTFSCLGIIGMYLSKIFIETKDRPYTIVRQSYDRSMEAGVEEDGVQAGVEGDRVQAGVEEDRMEMGD
jgi:putative glycosyltransferase